MIVSDQLVAVLAGSAVPSFAVLIGILINSRRLNELGRGMDVRFSEIDRRFNEVSRRLDHSTDILRVELLRMEQVLDVRLKHLEEHLR